PGHVTRPDDSRSPAPYRPAPAAAGLLALGLVVSSVIVSRAGVRAMRIKHADQTISVTGSARVRIRSDLAIWSCVVTVRGTEMAAASTALAAQIPRVREWLLGQGTRADEISLEPVGVAETHPYNSEGNELADQVNGYRLTQELRVTSHDVDRVRRVATDVTTLIGQNIQISSEAPRYLYTQLAQLKPRLLAEASRDARERAERIAQQSHAQISVLSNARMGVIQVNAANETETSSEGVNDTGSIEKDALGVVHSVFYTE
ncbi:MAG: SIMPL domain-containing protein, partial [Deltaproteobacteria bacterium]